MSGWRVAQISLLGLFSAVLAIILYMLITAVLPLRFGWFPMMLALMAVIATVLSPRRDSVFVLSLLLASMAVLVSGVVPEELTVVPGGAGEAFSFIWSALLMSFPFTFVHFALVFPVENKWIRGHRKRLVFLYGPYTFLILWSILDMGSSLSSSVLSAMVFPLGFFVGLVVFVRQYLFSLTAAERNRLRLILAGCVAGVFPRLLSIIGGEYFPVIGQQGALALLPLFPLAIALAVLKVDMSALGRPVRFLLVVFYALAGAILGASLSFVLVAVILGPVFKEGTLWVSLVVGLALLYPFSRWASSHVARRFASISQPLYRLAPAAEFTPIRPNPFIVGNPVRFSEMFFGRREDLRFIEEKLLDQPQGSIVVVTGERRSGKTSILFQIRNGYLGKLFVPIFFDMQGVPAKSDAEFLAFLSAGLEKEFPERPKQADARQISYLDFSRTVSSILNEIPGRRLVFLIDEYELLVDRIHSGKLTTEIPSFLNSLLEAHPRLSFVLTGSRKLVAEPAWQPLFSKAFYREISFLPRSDAEELLQRPLREKVEYTGVSLGSLIRLTNGQPFFTQLLGQGLVDLVNEEKKPLVDQKTVDELTKRVVDNPPPQIVYLWEAFSDEEHLVLAALGLLLRSPQEYASGVKVDRVIRSIPGHYRENWDQAQTRILLESLREKKVLDRDQTRYRFLMDLFRCWIRREQPVWRVLDSGGFRSIRRSSVETAAVNGN